VARHLPSPPDVLELDVTVPDHMDAVANHLTARWGALDGVLHSIGFAPPSCLGGGFLEAGWEDVKVALEVSAYSLKVLAAGLRPLLQAAGGGSVVGLDFDATVAWPGYDWMGVAKAALESTARYLARDLGPDGIRVNLVAAGPVKTMAANPSPASPASRKSGTNEPPWDGASPTPSRSPGRAWPCYPTGSRLPPANWFTSTAATTLWGCEMSDSDAGQSRDEGGRVVLVTGGNRGIGLAIARSFADAGDRVAISYRAEPVEGFLSVRCDVTSADDVDAAFKEIEAQLGPVEILVSNAGLNADQLLLSMKEDAWGRVIDTNLSGAYRVARRATSRMIRARRGRIILISSVVALTGSPGQTNYAASKAGLIGFARSLAREIGGRGVTVNVVTPGFVATDMTAALPDARRAEIVEQVPLGRMATPEEVAAAVRWLASEEAGYVTGAVIPVDGGLGMGH
jgi:3-oxoacyl-[acyl-carrier protein] reductase